VYRLGDRLQVRIVRVDLDNRKIDFELADAEAPPAGSDGRTRGKSRGSRRKR
jgi:ribonuclease R